VPTLGGPNVFVWSRRPDSNWGPADDEAARQRAIKLGTPPCLNGVWRNLSWIRSRVERKDGRDAAPGFRVGAAPKSGCGDGARCLLDDPEPPERPGPLFVLGTPGKGNFDFLPPPKREYTALEVAAEGMWGGGSYRASYVLSRTWGNYPGLFNSDAGWANPGGITTFWMSHQAENSTGYLPNDRTHVVQLRGSYATRFGLGVGTVFTFETGTPINDFAAGPNIGAYSPTFVAPRGSAGRTPSLWDLNFRLTYNFPIARRWQMQAVLDLLHVGNPRRAVWVDESHYLTLDANGNPGSPNPNYKQPIAYQPPMAARLGLEVNF